MSITFETMPEAHRHRLDLLFELSDEPVHKAQFEAIYKKRMGDFEDQSVTDCLEGWVFGNLAMLSEGTLVSNDPLHDAFLHVYCEAETRTGEMIEKATSADVTRDKKGNLVYRGQKFPGYNKPVKDSGGKQGRVLAKKGDQIKLIRFGDPKLRDNYSNDANDRFYARFGNKPGLKDKFSPLYWSARWLWPRGAQKGKGPKDFYVLKSAELEVKKAYNDEERTALFVVLPVLLADQGEFDLHGDAYDELEVRKAMLNYNRVCGRVGLYHGSQTDIDSVQIVSSYTTPADFYMQNEEGENRLIRKGSWLHEYYFEKGGQGDELYEKVKAGEITGVSVQCSAEVEDYGQVGQEEEAEA